jgi:hypothetical protein
MNSPVDTMAPHYQTEARLTFDQHFFYVSFVCYDEMTKPNIVQSLRRDFDFDLNDNIGIFFDPYNDHTNGFFSSLLPTMCSTKELKEAVAPMGIRSTAIGITSGIQK